MNYTKILIKEDGAYALPEIRLAVIGKTAKYDFDRLTKQAYQQALDNAVRFNDQQMVRDAIYEGTCNIDECAENCECFFKKAGVCFDVPPNFEIVIENGVQDPCKQCNKGLREQYHTPCSEITCYKGQRGYLKQYATLKNIK
jgi:hypothetical protein